MKNTIHESLPLSGVKDKSRYVGMTLTQFFQTIANERKEGWHNRKTFCIDVEDKPFGCYRLNVNSIESIINDYDNHFGMKLGDMYIQYAGKNIDEWYAEAFINLVPDKSLLDESVLNAPWHNAEEIANKIVDEIQTDNDMSQYSVLVALTLLDDVQKNIVRMQTKDVDKKRSFMKLANTIKTSIYDIKQDLFDATDNTGEIYKSDLHNAHR